jgi:hypothetical protein
VRIPRVLCAAACAAALLSGCMSSGVEVKPEQTASFRPGVTTDHEVVARLGAPTARTTLPDGSTIMTYAFSAAQARPASFIPIIGAFAGGADARSSAVTFRFGPDHLLQGSSSTSSQSGTQLGTTTTTAPLTTDQPRQVQ